MDYHKLKMSLYFTCMFATIFIVALFSIIVGLMSEKNLTDYCCEIITAVLNLSFAAFHMIMYKKQKKQLALEEKEKK